MPTAPDPLAGDVPAEPAPRGRRRFTPWVAALLAVVVVVGWFVLSRNPRLEAEGSRWSSPATVTCADESISLHSSEDAAVTDGSPVYAALVRNSSQFPVTISAEQPAGFRVAFTGVVDVSTAASREPGSTTASVSVPTGQTVSLVVSAASPLPALADDASVGIARVRLRTTTLGTTSSQDFVLPDQVMIYGGETPPDGYRCS
ncbi:hypothetical protein [Luteimicrobium sp. DT211]|uniref:hypothetical protein n=1 Tax=Luteimicrobium sp. DT211 TaxID=3393412 RepID=UPI003CF8B1BF